MQWIALCLPLRDRHGMNIQRGPARNILRERRGERFLADGPGTRGTSDIDIVSKVTGHD
jgi:hypothetical protein